MKDLKELIREINENPACIADIEWKEATNGFSQHCLEELMEGISDLEVMKDVAELIKFRHRLAEWQDDECLYVLYSPNATYTGDDGVTRPHPRAGKREWNLRVEYWTTEWVYCPNGRRYKEWIDRDLGRFLDLLIEWRTHELKTLAKEKEIREKYANRTEETSPDEKRKVFEAIKTLHNENLIEYNYQYLWLKYVLEDNNLFTGSNQEFADWLAESPFDEPIKGKLPKADILKKYDSKAQYENGRFEWLEDFPTKKKEKAEMLAKRFLNLLK